MPRAFKKWLEKWYPQEADVYDTYKTLHREWLPRKRVILQMGVLFTVILIAGLPLSMVYYSGSPSFWRDTLGIAGLIAVLFLGVMCMAITDIIYDRRSAKPTPPREKQ